ncbi:MAG: signal peptidase I [Candidatus Methanospirareceae archaeon]
MKGNRRSPLLAKEIAKELALSFIEALIIVAIIISVAYAATGTWYVAFAVESGSMEPNMHRGDLIFVVSPSRVNIITYEEGVMTGYKSFGDYGDVIIYYPNGITSQRIIHRAMYWVEKGERMPNGEPAPHAGYITKGDNNPGTDQQFLYVDHQRVEPVKPEWIIGVARVRIPYVGYIRLIFPF